MRKKPNMTFGLFIYEHINTQNNTKTRPPDSALEETKKVAVSGTFKSGKDQTFKFSYSEEIQGTDNIFCSWTF